MKFYYTHKAWFWTIISVLSVFFHFYDMLWADYIYMQNAEFLTPDYLKFYLILYIQGIIILVACSFFSRGYKCTIQDVLMYMCL